ncbi:hypothetical protein O9992_13795 [Vibrio lentus]|nr:hypothetical protein [Vibrio lentus]
MKQAFYDGKTGNSHSVTFNEDEVQAGYIPGGQITLLKRMFALLPQRRRSRTSLVM